MNWAQEEVRMADLGDKRLNARLGLVLEQLGQKPQLSIPTARGGLRRWKLTDSSIIPRRLLKTC